MKQFMVLVGIHYSYREDLKAIELAKKLGIEITTNEEGNEVASYTATMMSGETYLENYKYLDKPELVKELA